MAAIALTVLGALIITAIMVSSKSSSNSARERLDAAASDVLARDASAVMSDAFSDLEASELDGFVIDRPILQRHAEQLGAGATVIPNGSGQIPTELRRVDTARVPAAGQFTMVQRLDDDRLGYWQVYSMKVPTWGTTPGARLTAYVRSWATPRNGSGFTTRPMVHRVELRPTWFTDFQMLFDGPFYLGAGATISGRIHSNGYETSLFNQYQQLVDEGVSIKSDPIVCTATARVSTAAGRIDTSCPSSQERSSAGQRYNLLRARDMVARIRAFCGGGGGGGVQLVCTRSTGEATVRLSGSSVSVSAPGFGSRTVSAGVSGDRPGQSQGAVILHDGNIRLSGQLGSRARAMVVAASTSDSATYGTGSAPSVWVTSGGSVGAPSNDDSSSFGVVAEGSLVLDHTRACGVTYRGAAVTMTGLVSFNPQWLLPFEVAGPTCPQPANLVGSISGHYPPNLTSRRNGGYSGRTYDYLQSLYDNPPPLYPTVSDWEVTRLAPANLRCFAGGSLNTGEDSGCV